MSARIVNLADLVEPGPGFRCSFCGGENRTTFEIVPGVWATCHRCGAVNLFESVLAVRHATRDEIDGLDGYERERFQRTGVRLPRYFPMTLEPDDRGLSS